MIQVKIFESSLVNDLQDRINYWISNNGKIKIEDIKFNSFLYGAATKKYKAMIIYDRMG